MGRHAQCDEINRLTRLQQEFSPDVEERRIQVSMLMDHESSGVGIKRTRDEEEVVEQVWTEEEVGQLQAVRWGGLPQGMLGGREWTD
jgi:hypothetical protein